MRKGVLDQPIAAQYDSESNCSCLPKSFQHQLMLSPKYQACNNRAAGNIVGVMQFNCNPVTDLFICTFKAPCKMAEVVGSPRWWFTTDIRFKKRYWICILEVSLDSLLNCADAHEVCTHLRWLPLIHSSNIVMQAALNTYMVIGQSDRGP